MFWGTIILLLVFWSLYLLTKHIFFSKVLTWLHIILLVLTSISLVAILFYFNYQGLAGMLRRYYDYISWDTMVQSEGLPKLIVVCILCGEFNAEGIQRATFNATHSTYNLPPTTYNLPPKTYPPHVLLQRNKTHPDSIHQTKRI